MNFSSRHPLSVLAASAALSASVLLAGCVVQPPQGPPQACWNQDGRWRCVPLESPTTTAPPVQAQVNVEFTNVATGPSNIALDDVVVTADGTEVLADHFDGADGALTTPWVQAGQDDTVVSSNQITVVGDSSYTWLDLTMDDSQDLSISATVAQLPGSPAGDQATISLETVESFAPDLVLNDDGVLALVYLDANGDVQLVPAGSAVQGDTIELRADADGHLTVLVNGVQTFAVDA